MAIFIPEHNLTFIHIPKTGGSSITQWLKQNTNVVYYKKHCTLDTAKLFSKDIGTAFCVIRNPYDWMVSWYEYEKVDIKNSLDRIKDGNVKISKINPEKHSLSILERKLDILNRGFEYYVKHTNKDPQIMWAKDCDIILNFNDLNKNFKHIQLITNCHEPLKKINTSKRKNIDNYYTPKLKKFIHKKYQEDFELFYKS